MPRDHQADLRALVLRDRPLFIADEAWMAAEDRYEALLDAFLEVAHDRPPRILAVEVPDVLDKVGMMAPLVAGVCDGTAGGGGV